MISSVVTAQSHLSVITIVFYTCLWIPFCQIQQFMQKMLDFLMYYPYPRPVNEAAIYVPTCCDLKLPASRFPDVQGRSSIDGEVEESCSICLMEYEKENVVCELPSCKHVFHMECIERWVERGQFTCPLCRSLLLHRTADSPCK
uniref:RING-H2 finger protein ATL18-like n=1 Tax=Nicotiana tabacum TaxID=4097 RepID=A0A1S4D6T3_TOBAC|nr:PREDICTED: RING-H2 finger protein ATL18-like [Nicotiana tabacum]